MPIYLQHFRMRLALHCLREAKGPALLLLHGLGEQSPALLAQEYCAWPGSVHALDFTGHGASSVPSGGGYSCEALLADADAALAHLGAATLVGRGLGAYIGLMLAGTRPKRVRGAILCDGPGLAGAGLPALVRVATQPAQGASVDPSALIELAADFRPAPYARAFAQQAAAHSGLEQPFLVCARERPDWLAAAVHGLALEPMAMAQCLRYYAHEAWGSRATS
jgi:pimeloyl-ACP methyl ester carboxylesterase